MEGTMGPPEHNGHAWATGNNFPVCGLCRAMEHAHLVALVDTLQPLQAKSKTIS